MSATVPGQSHLGALPCAPRSPVSEGHWVLYGPFCKVESCIPRDQAGGAMGNDGRALRERDRVSGRLDGDRDRELIQLPEDMELVLKRKKNHNR